MDPDSRAALHGPGFSNDRGSGFNFFGLLLSQSWPGQLRSDYWANEGAVLIGVRAPGALLALDQTACDLFFWKVSFYVTFYF